MTHSTACNRLLPFQNSIIRKERIPFQLVGGYRGEPGNGYLDIREGTFVHEQPHHPYFLEGKESAITSQLLKVMQPDLMLTLNITRELVQLMGGAVGMTSTPGQGSTFWMELPFETPADEPSEPEPRLGGRVIVLGGRDQTARLAATVEDFGCEVRCVATVESGYMTKDLALLIGPDQPWLSTTGFLDKIDENLKKAMG